jgi:hypothetical protein
MGADAKCDAIVGGNTCNLFNTNDDGLCSMHRAQASNGVPVLTLRTLQTEADLSRVNLRHAIESARFRGARIARLEAGISECEGDGGCRATKVVNEKSGA